MPKCRKSGSSKINFFCRSDETNTRLSIIMIHLFIARQTNVANNLEGGNGSVDNG